MRLQRVTLMLLLTAFLISGTACKTFVVKDVNYSQQIESVLTPDEYGMVHDIRYGISFNITPFQKMEMGEKDSTQIDEVRLIRNSEGFYFITANNFKNVYVMEPGKGELKLKNKIKVSEERLSAPAFNLRDSVVQLVKVDTNEVIRLKPEGIQDNTKEKTEGES